LLNIGCLPAAANRFGLRGTRAEASSFDRLDTEDRQPVKNISTIDVVMRACFEPPFLYADKRREEKKRKERKRCSKQLEMTSNGDEQSD